MYRIKASSPHITQFVKQLRIRGMSEKTTLGYVQSLEYFLAYYRGIKPSQLTIDHIHDY